MVPCGKKHKSLNILQVITTWYNEITLNHNVTLGLWTYFSCQIEVWVCG